MSSVVAFAAEDPGYTGGTLIGDYTLNADFAATELGKMIIGDKTTADGPFVLSYTNDGATISRSAVTNTSTSPLASLAINFAGLVGEDNVNNTKTYQQGFSGIYGFEVTMSFNVTPAGSNSGRTDFYLNNSLNSGSNPSANNIIRYMPKSKSLLDYNSSSSSSYYSGVTAGNDYTIRFVVDTDNGKRYAYSVSDGTYSYRGELAYSSTPTACLTLSPRPGHWAEGSSITIKNIKVYEISRSDAAATVLTAFEDSIPASIVAEPNNVTGSFTMPPTLAEAGTVTSSDENIVATDGTVAEVDEDKNVTIKVAAPAASGIYLNKFYNLVVKPSTLAINTLDITYYSSTNAAEAKIKLDETYTEGNVCLIMAVFDTNKLVKKLYVASELSSDNVLSCATDIALQSGYSVKAFLFDSITSGIPYLDAKELPIN